MGAEWIKQRLPAKWLTRFRIYKKKFIRWRAKGNSVICPICKASFKTFDSYGSPKRYNAKCYDCFSLERHRLVWLYLLEKTDLVNSTKPLRVLHTAPAGCLYSRFSTIPSWDYVASDLQPEYFADAEVTKVDLCNIPFEDEAFDVVISIHVLEHIPDDHKAMREIFRVVKKGGQCILQVPIDYDLASTYEDDTLQLPHERKKAFGQEDHVRQYGRDYPLRLAAVGFKVKEDDYVSQFNEQDRFRYGLDPTERVYLCQKP